MDLEIIIDLSKVSLHDNRNPIIASKCSQLSNKQIQRVGLEKGKSVGTL